MKKMRLDLVLVERGLVGSRRIAQALIMRGAVRVEGVVQIKPGTQVDPEISLEVENPSPQFVSRGGLKLKKAIDEFGVRVAGKVALDGGASTGGFTDCLLKEGASRVYAVDVGYGQLDWNLRQDPRVISLERTNLRHIDQSIVNEPVDLVTLDLSFISVEKVLPAVLALLKKGGEVIILIKPQFEAGPEKVSRGGVVRDPRVHREVLSNLMDAAAGMRLYPSGLTFSPIKGPAGNIEYLALLRKPATATPDVPPLQVRIEDVVEQAFKSLSKRRGGHASR